MGNEERRGAVDGAPSTWWNAAFDANSDIVCVISTDDDVLEINEAGCVALGLPRSQIVGQKCSAVTGGALGAIAECLRTLRHGTAGPFRQVCDHDGRGLELTGWPIPDPEGRARAFVFVVKDNTESLRAEHALFRALIDQSTDTFEVIDPVTGRFLDVNERGHHDHGYTRDEYLAMHVWDVDPGVDAAVFASVANDLRNLGTMRWEGTHRRKDGSTFPVEVNLRYARIDREYLIGVVRDVTERAESEKALQRSLLTQEAISTILRLSLEDLPLDEMLQRALDIVLSIPWLSLERKGAILVVGDVPGVLVMRAKLGLSGELTGRCARVPFGECLCGRAASTGQLVHASGLDDRHDRLFPGMSTHGHYCVPITFAGEVCGVFNAYLRAGHAYVQREADFLTAVADAFAGIIVRKKAEAERAHARAQMRQSDRLLAVGRLAGGVAHDFNNLLTVIQGCAAFATDLTLASDPIREDLKEILNASQRASALTQQLLAFSRKQALEPRPLDINEAVRSMASMLRRLLGEDVELEVRTAHDLGIVMADPGQIEQVIMNLAVNARDAMPDGGRFTIETRNIDEPEARYPGMQGGRYVLISTTDSGRGMDADTVSHIFEPFFTTKELGSGTGLGLATVHGIVKQSGGEIWVESEPGSGTTFRVALPRTSMAARSMGSKTSSLRPGNGETVLIVEDESALRRLAARILRSAGYNVLVASSGGEALLLCEQHDGGIDLVLTDVVMPLMSGPELAKRLAVARPQLKVLFMSGYTDDRIGPVDPSTARVQKPFSGATLTRRVREMLDGEKA